MCLHIPRFTVSICFSCHQCVPICEASPIFWSVANPALSWCYECRKQCTPDRFLALSRLFHKHLFTAPLPRQQQRSGTTVSEPQSMALKLVRRNRSMSPWSAIPAFCTLRHAVCHAARQYTTFRAEDGMLLSLLGAEDDEFCLHALCISKSERQSFMPHIFVLPLAAQATVLLLEMLDVDKALSAVAEGTPLTQDNYAFAAADTRRQVLQMRHCCMHSVQFVSSTACVSAVHQYWHALIILKLYRKEKHILHQFH